MAECEYAIEMPDIMQNLGLETLEDEEIRKVIYLEICSRLEDELMVRRNKIFEWSDSKNIDIDGESYIDTYWVIVIDGKIIQIDLEYDGITLNGPSRECQKMGKQILKFVKNLSKKSILRKIKPLLMEYQQADLRNWEARKTKKEPKTKKKRNLH